ncbi:MAG: hypothetical protein A2921_02895 [Candidatus Magasanikbacteria bacterium RIFCSPLOWO2_01_FULL_43_20b]|uniref:ASCH domain-containing protein n=1 Tax=Candidatus Magasanikbacteria bacterium RIFCSPLOWO2_12_FULL_43_12 TaxID=1798692 RepID=A0A1F6MTU1_9BACT|nr:MAG: hypothetical protein A3C74_00750 [Candidatus Magasanikbacteria bacterium RIFCSPHIGHO2_02_FULL_44_13]OGH72735.1 MAG: hypothetical protein A3I93_04035 [Candidatus Magasanikbacteria bacterium RIFCSPLOWO2_02_FULL_43_22]OGH72948.1 MAG: hypothetical protein A2921_02895 [Candidatus Magasanikbacteria bacterium RIFCSPLOWO2_01_FULL_43_20b]OGH75032.1 MAG: hypothetical protein A3G00_01335 [Candidatus Magasanikbacteria bacterium RIFCSPLOWO2_12_FULL_43_12]
MIKISVQEPYFSYIMSGEKTVEGRLNKDKFLELEVGDILEINGQANFKIIKKNTYKNFREMIMVEGVNNVLPDKNNIDEAVDVYYRFYSKQDETAYGVVGIILKKI